MQIWKADALSKPLTPPKRFRLVKVWLKSASTKEHFHATGSKSAIVKNQNHFLGLHWKLIIAMKLSGLKPKGPPSPPGLRPGLCAVTPESAAAPLTAPPPRLPDTAARIRCVSLEETDDWELLTASKKNLPDILMTFLFFLRGNACIVHTHCVYQALCFNNFISAGRSNNTRERCGWAFTGNKLTSHSPTSARRSAFLKQIPIRGRGRDFKVLFWFL